MNAWRLISILLLIAVLSLGSIGSVFASPGLQEEEKVGLFGTVVAVEGSTIKLDTGEEVETTAETGFKVPLLTTASLADISDGDRLSILALKGADGSLTALQAVVVPGEPVDNSHVLGVVTDTTNGTVTLTDAEGNSFMLELPPGTPPVGVGGFLTVVQSRSKATGQMAPKAVRRIEDVIDRLVKDIDRAVGKAVERLRVFAERNSDARLTGLENALQRVGAQARGALQTALVNASSSHDEIVNTVKKPGRYEKAKEAKYKGTVYEFVEGSHIQLNDENGPILTINEDTEIEGDLGEGTKVKVKGAEIDGTLIALEVDAKEEEEYEGEFEGTVFDFVEGSHIQLNDENGPIFTITEDTKIKGLLYAGAEVELKVTGSDGDVITKKIEVEEDSELKSEYEGIVFDLSDTHLQLNDENGPTIVINKATKTKGRLTVGAEVEVEGIMFDSILYALEIKVEGRHEGRGTCDGEITSDHKGNLDVLSDATCTIKSGAEVKGNIKVEGGTLVITEASSVDGNLLGGGGASITVEVNSSVDGNVEHKGGSGDLTITDSHVDNNVVTRTVGTVSITGSVIDGNIISRGDGTVEIRDNAVDGNIDTEGGETVTVTGNNVDGNINSRRGGTVVVSGNVVEDNLTIAGAASCTEANNTVEDNNLGCESEAGGPGALQVDGQEEEREQEKFEGTIVSIDGDTWTMTIDGETRTVDVSDAEIDGTPDVALAAEVKGTVGDGDVIMASEVKVQEEMTNLDRGSQGRDSDWVGPSRAPQPVR